MLEKAELTYLAGLFEGEGSFGTNGKSASPLLRIGMTDKDVVAKVATLMPGGYWYYKRDPRGNNKPVWYYHHTGLAAKLYMQAMYPYLGRRRRARIDEICQWEPKLRTKKRKAIQAAIERVGG